MVDIDSKNVQTTKDGYISENSNVEINYNYWTNHGLMSFRLFNKSDKPIYIDWKKSSFVKNDNKYDYWINEEVSEVSYYGNTVYNRNIFDTNIDVSSSVSNGVSRTSRQERITFIPPKSSITVSKFLIVPEQFFNIEEYGNVEETKLNGSDEKMTEIHVSDFNEQESPITFRNFITFSFTETFEEEFYLDDEFYISSIKKMDYKHFKYKEDFFSETFIRPYKSPSKFYLYVSPIDKYH
ncbi:MAG: hypothetical protein ACQETL_18425 [Bacteroidota bacterium]